MATQLNTIEPGIQTEELMQTISSGMDFLPRTLMHDSKMQKENNKYK